MSGYKEHVYIHSTFITKSVYRVTNNNLSDNAPMPSTQNENTLVPILLISQPSPEPRTQ